MNRPILEPGRGSSMSETKNPFLSFRVIIIILVALIVVTIIVCFRNCIYSRILRCPGVNKPRDLGVKADPAQFSALLARENVKLNGKSSDFYLTAPIRYGLSVPHGRNGLKRRNNIDDAGDQ